MKAVYREPASEPILVCAGVTPHCAPCCRSSGGATHCPIHCRTPGKKITWAKCVGIEMPAVPFKPNWPGFFVRLGVIAVCLPLAALAMWNFGVAASAVSGPSASDVLMGVSSCAVSAISGQQIPPLANGGLYLSAGDAGLNWRALDVCPGGWEVQCDDERGSARCPTEPSFVLESPPPACKGTRRQHLFATGVTDGELWTVGYLAMDGGAR